MNFLIVYQASSKDADRRKHEQVMQSQDNCEMQRRKVHHDSTRDLLAINLKRLLTKFSSYSKLGKRSEKVL